MKKRGYDYFKADDINIPEPVRFTQKKHTCVNEMNDVEMIRRESRAAYHGESHYG